MTRDEESQFLAAGARDMGVILNAMQCQSLLKLVDELEAGNAQFNLTAIRDEHLIEHPDPRSAPRAASGYRRCRDC